MKDCDRETFESIGTGYNARDLIELCLKQLRDDKTKRPEDFAVKNLTYEELIGTLHVARDELAGDV